MGPAPLPMGDHLGPLDLDFTKIGANLAQLGVSRHVLTLAQTPEHFVDHSFGLGGSHANYRKLAMLQMSGTTHMAKYIYFEGPSKMPLAHVSILGGVTEKSAMAPLPFHDPKL